MRVGSRLVLFAACALVAAPALLPRAVGGETVTVVGANGSQPGEAGQSATARADAPCQDNTANATGGDGASATGTPGGNGGDATAEATATCGTRVVAHAEAGS